MTTLAGSKFRAKMSADSRKRTPTGNHSEFLYQSIAPLELIFPSPQGRKNLGRRLVTLAVPFVCFLFNRCFGGAQEGISELFQGQGRGQGNDAFVALPADFFQTGGDIWIARFHRGGKLQVAEGIFMGAVDQRIFGQGGEAAEGVVHLPRRPFEEPTATGGKQRVATKQQAVVVVGDMPQGVSRYGVDLEIQAEHAERVVVIERHIPRWDVFTGRAMDGGARCVFQHLDAADMIMVMVGDQYVAQGPAWVGVEPGLHGRGITRVDHGAALGRVIL